jgi:hypothetical protein
MFQSKQPLPAAARSNPTLGAPRKGHTDGSVRSLDGCTNCRARRKKCPGPRRPDVPDDACEVTLGCPLSLTVTYEYRDILRSFQSCWNLRLECLGRFQETLTVEMSEIHVPFSRISWSSSWLASVNIYRGAQFLWSLIIILAAVIVPTT